MIHRVIHSFSHPPLRAAPGVLAIAALVPASPFAASLEARQVDPSTLVPTPAPEDVATIDGTLTAVYGAISGPAGPPRDRESEANPIPPSWIGAGS